MMIESSITGDCENIIDNINKQNSALWLHKKLQGKIKSQNDWDKAKKQKEAIYYITQPTERPKLKQEPKPLPTLSLKELNAKRY